jgi:hypothetical protein
VPPYNPYASPGSAPASAQHEAMAVPVLIPGLENRVCVRMRSITGRSGFVVDGVLARPVRGVVEVTDAAGRIRKLRLKGLPFDPCPRVAVDGVIIDVCPRLSTWVTMLCMIPLALILCGAVPAVLGVFAVCANFRIARTGVREPLKLVLGFLATSVAIGITVALAFLVRFARR